MVPDNAAPTDIALAPDSVPENEAAGAVVGTLSTIDADAGDTHTYSLVAGDGDADNGSFVIDGDQLKTAVGLDHETQGACSIRVQTDDGNGGSYEEAFTITVTNVDEAPVLDLDTAEAGIDNSDLAFTTGGAPVPLLEPGAGAVLTESDGDLVISGQFQITNVVPGEDVLTGTSDANVVFGVYDAPSGTLPFTSTGDLAQTLAALQTVTYHNTSGTPDQTARLIDATVTDNGAPALSNDPLSRATVAINASPTDIALDNSSVAENAAIGTAVGALSTTDPDAGDTHSYSFVAGVGDADNASFTIAGDQLKTAAVFDYESKSSYTVRVQTADGRGGTYGEAFSVSVTDESEAPAATNMTQNQPYAQGAAGVALDDIVVTDPDAGDAITTTLTLADPATGALSATSGNAETYTPGTGVWTVTGNVADVNAALAAVAFLPVATNDYDTTVATHVEDAVGTGPVDGTITLDVTPAPRDFGDLPPAYGLTLWANDGARHVVGGLILGVAVDAEADGQECADAGRAGDAGDDNAVGTDDEDGVTVVGPWRNGLGGGAVQVTVTGGSGYLSAWIDWAGNDNLSDAGDQVLAMAPVSAGTQTLTFDIPAGVITTEGAYERFARFRLDDDNARPLAPTGAADNGEVEDHALQFDGVLNAAPTDIALSNGNLAENLPADTAVGTFTTTDLDPADTHTYSLVAGTGDTHNAPFAIDGDTLETAAVLDYEATSTCSIRVQTDDGKGGTYQEVFTIAVLDGPNLAIAPDGADNAEGDAGDTAFTLTVTRTGDTAGAVSATWTVSSSGGSAATADDFDTVFPTGTVTFADGETEQTVTINVAGDAVVEPDEGFDVTLSSPSAGAEIATASASGTIRNDDTLVVEFSQDTGGDTETGGGNLPQLLVTGTVQAGHSVTIDVAVTGGTAASPADFTAPTTLTVPGGTYSAQAFAIPSLAIVGGSMVEPDETLELGNITGSAVTVGDANSDGTTQSTTSYTVTDDDSAQVSIAATTNGAETGPVNGVFTVTQTAASSTDTVLSYSVGGTAAPGSDYTALSGTVTISAGATSATITVTVTDDGTVEATETVSVTLTGITAGDPDISVDGGNNSAAPDIVDNDKASISVDDISQAEDGTFRFTVSSDRDASADMTVLASTAGNTAGSDVDFTAFADQLVTIAAGATSATVTVTVADDAIVETNETFLVDLTDPKFDGATDATRVEIGDPQGQATIQNNDTASLSIDDISLAEDGTFTFTVTSDKEASADLTVLANTADGTATSPGDFAAITDQTVIIGAGATTQTVTVTVVDDELVEDAETFVVNLTDPKFDGATDASRVGIGDTQGQGTIWNNEADYGDAPDTYGTTAAANGAQHSCVYGFQLGAAIDGDADGQSTADATGDDADAHGDDEDGIVFNATLVKADVDTTCSVTVTASSAGKLDAWMDFNQNGVFDDPAERLFPTTDLSTGENIVPFAVPSSATVGNTFARFRFSSAGGLLPTGSAADGEVEDCRKEIIDGTTEQPVGVDVPSGGDFVLSLDVLGGDNILVEDDIGTDLLLTPMGSVGSLTLTGSSGDDTFTIDLSNGDAIPAGGLIIHGEGGSDSVVVTSATFGTMVYTFSGGGSGTIDFDNDGNVDITYDGLEPIDNTGVDETDIVFSLNAGCTDAELRDHGAAGDGNSQLDFALGSDEDIYFKHPGDSLTVTTNGSNSVVRLKDMDNTFASTTTTVVLTGQASDVFYLDATDVFGSATDLTVTTATLDLNGNAETIDALAGTGPIALGVVTLEIGASDGSSSYSGAISGTGGLTKSGAGTITLSGTNAYSGTTGINAGTLALDALNAIDADSDVSIALGAALDLNGNSHTLASLAGAGNVVTGGGTLSANADDSSTVFSGVISGNGGLTKVGAGTLTLSGANTYSGATAISAGTLQLGASDVIADDSDVNVVGILDLNGNSDTVGALSGAGDITLGAGTLKIGDTANTTFSGVISDGGGFAKAGAGTLTLSGANTYTGATTINGGTLSVTGSLANTAVTVNAGATLKGTGAITGSVTSTGGTVAPGLSPGQLSTGSVSFDSNTTFSIELNGTVAATGYDQLVVSGTVSLGDATLTGTVGFAPSPGTKFIIIDNDGVGDTVSGTFGGMAEGATITLDGVEFAISYQGGDGNDVELTTAPPAMTYVNEDWSGTPPGADPDGPGPAHAYGWDAFDTVQGGVSGVRAMGTVYIYTGTYAENVQVTKGVSITRAGTTEEPVLQGAGTAISITSTDVTITHLGVKGYTTGITSNSGATINYCEFSGNDTAVSSTAGADIDAEHNWWGHISGPSNTDDSIASGEGDGVTDNVNYRPWWGSEDWDEPYEYYLHVPTPGTTTLQQAVDSVIVPDAQGIVVHPDTYVGDVTITRPLYMDAETAFTIDGDVTFDGEPVLITGAVLQNPGTDDADDAWHVTTNGQIADGAYAANTGETVWVHDGTHTLKRQILVASKDINVWGTTNAETNIVDGNDTFRGFYLTDAAGTVIQDLTIQNCNAHEGADEPGGGLYSDDGGTVLYCIIQANTATHGGGAYLKQTTTAGLLRNCLILENTATTAGGGVYIEDGGVAENCTVTGNSAHYATDAWGGGIYCHNGGTISNSISYFNKGVHGDNYSNNGAPTYQYSCMTPLIAGTGNIEEDPQFRSAGDYVLEYWDISYHRSPCLDAGNNEPWMDADTDLPGNDRIIEQPEGYGGTEVLGDGKVDMGAYECTYLDQPGSFIEPDFIIARVIFDPASPAPGATFTAYVTIRNMGRKQGNPGWIELWTGAAAGVTNGWGRVGMLQVGEYKTFRFDGLTAGADQMTIIVDSDQETEEQSELNNERTFWY